MDKRTFAEIGIIGGTGVYDLLDFLVKREISKFILPSATHPTLSQLENMLVKKWLSFRGMGKGHRIPPHRINNRANIWALKELGVKRIIAPTAVGSMKYEYRPGDIAIPDQFVDFTKGRQYTFYDGGEVCHISVADPFCLELRDVAVCHGNKLGYNVHTKATYVCVEGPRFSTRAESQFFRDVLMADIIGMTLVPNARLLGKQKFATSRLQWLQITMCGPTHL